MTFPPSTLARPHGFVFPNLGVPARAIAALALAGLVVVLLWSVVMLRIYEPGAIYTAYQTYPVSVAEAAVLGPAGGVLAGGTGFVVSRLFTQSTGVVAAFAVGCCFVGAANGVIAGHHGIYDWSNSSGYLAFMADSSTGLLGTALGLGVHAHNQVAGIDLNPLGYRNNVFVYDTGFGLPGYAITQGNVISNLQGQSSLLAHESLHAWQSRAFGPLYQVVYIGWSLGGALFGIGAAAGGNGAVGANIHALAYEANPWEIWAYSMT